DRELRDEQDQQQQRRDRQYQLGGDRPALLLAEPPYRCAKPAGKACGHHMLPPISLALRVTAATMIAITAIAAATSNAVTRTVSVEYPRSSARMSSIRARVVAMTSWM